MSNEGSNEFVEYGNINTAKFAHKTDIDEDELWISGEELNTEESTDEEECKAKSKKQTHKSRGKTCVSQTKNKNQYAANVRSSSGKSDGAELSKESGEDNVDLKEETLDETPCWRPKRGSIKLSDLEGYHLTQVFDKEPSDSSVLSDDPVASGNEVYSWYEEDELFSDISLKFLKDIELNDLNEILQKYLQSDQTELPDNTCTTYYNNHDAKNLGGIYAEFMTRDPSLNDALLKMSKLDRILTEKTRTAEEFLRTTEQNDENDTTNRICRTEGYTKNVRSKTSTVVKNNVNSQLRAVKSADNSFEDLLEEKLNPIKLTDEEQKRLEQLLENVTDNVQDEVELRAGEGYLITYQDKITLNDLDSKLKLLSEEKSPTQHLDENSEAVEREFNKKYQMFQKNELLREIDSKLDMLLRNKNKKEKPLSSDELDKLLKSIPKVMHENTIPDKEPVQRITSDWTALFENFEPIRPISTLESESQDCQKITDNSVVCSRD